MAHYLPVDRLLEINDHDKMSLTAKVLLGFGCLGIATGVAFLTQLFLRDSEKPKIIIPDDKMIIEKVIPYHPSRTHKSRTFYAENNLNNQNYMERSC